MLLAILFTSLCQATWVPAWSVEMDAPITGLHFMGQKAALLISLKSGQLLEVNPGDQSKTLVAQSKLKSGAVNSFGESIFWVLDRKLYEVKAGVPVLAKAKESDEWRWNEKGEAFAEQGRGSFQLWQDLYELGETEVTKNGKPTGDLCKGCSQLYRWSTGGWLSKRGKVLLFFQGKKEETWVSADGPISFFTVVYSREIKDILLVIATGKTLKAWKQDAKI